MESDAKTFEMWWPGTELNRRRQPFQGCALPPELPGHFLRATLSAHVYPNNDSRPIWPCTGRSHWAGCREVKQPMRWNRAELSNYNNPLPFPQNGGTIFAARFLSRVLSDSFLTTKDGRSARHS